MESPNIKLERLNHAFKKAIALILLELFPGDQPVEVSTVLLDASLKTGRVWLLTSAGRLNEIEKKRVEIQNMIQNHVKTRFTPRLTFLQEDNYLQTMDQLFEQLNNSETK